MTVKECYDALGGNYDEILGRFRNEDRIRRFAGKFLSDPSYDNLIKALEEGNMDEAFRASHTIKGVSQNLSFTKLYESSHELTELIRSGQTDHLENALKQVKEDYERTVAAVKQL